MTRIWIDNKGVILDRTHARRNPNRNFTEMKSIEPLCASLLQATHTLLISQKALLTLSVGVRVVK